MNSSLGLQPVPLYFLGDSHTLIHGDRFYRNGHTAQPFVGRALYLNGLQMCNLATAEGDLIQPVLATLETHMLIVPSDDGFEAFHRSNRQHWRRVGVATGRPRAEPYLILTAGCLDAVDVLRRHAERTAPAADGLERRTLTLDEIRTGLAPSISALVSTIRRLQELGFGRTFVQSVEPFTDDGDRFEYYFFVKTTRKERRDVVVAFNDAIRDACAGTGVPFVDTWAVHTIAGAAVPGLLHDDVHLAPEYASTVVDAVFACESQLTCSPEVRGS